MSTVGEIRFERNNEEMEKYRYSAIISTLADRIEAEEGDL